MDQVNANTTKSASSELYGKWQDVLSKVNGSFVIDFGKSDNQKIEKIQKELEEDMDIVEVMTINGEKKLIRQIPSVTTAIMNFFFLSES